MIIMKLLDICSSIPSSGIHHYAAMIDIGLKNRGMEVKIVSSPGEADPGIRKRLKSEKIDVIDLPRPEKRGFINAMKTSAFLKQVLRDFQPDVIHTWGLIHSIRFWIALRRAGVKKWIPIVTTLSSIRHGRAEEWPARIVAAKILNRLPGRLCVQCSSEKSKMLKAGMLEKKLRVVPLCVENNYPKEYLRLTSAQFKNKYNLERRIAIVYLAQFVPRKGHIYLLVAAKKVIAKYPECLFVLAGTGSFLGKVRTEAYKMGLGNNVLFPGRIDVGDVPALLDSATLAVVPSLAETFGSVIVEPLVIGRPVVTTDVGIAADIAAAGGVAMVNTHDPEALARALLYYIDNPDIAQEDAKRGKEFIMSNCSLKVVAKNYLTVFEEHLL